MNSFDKVPTYRIEYLIHAGICTSLSAHEREHMLYPHVPLGRRTLSSLRATCAWSGGPPASRERLGLLRPGLMGTACRLVPASPSAVLEEPWLTSRLSGRTRLTAKEDDHWEEEEEEEEEAFCGEMGRIWSESMDAVRGELLFWKRDRDEFSNQHYIYQRHVSCHVLDHDTTSNMMCTNQVIQQIGQVYLIKWLWCIVRTCRYNSFNYKIQYC